MSKPIVRETIDNTQFEELKALLEDDFINLVQEFVVESKQKVATLKQAYDKNDNTNGFDVAHSLKGASANLGAKRLTDLCYELQEACRHHKIEQKQNLIEQIANEMRAVQQEINMRLS